MSRRRLNTATAPALYSAHATVTGDRNGHAEAENLSVDLAMPQSLGGAGGKTNPEELFAAGYAACFQSAMAVSAPLVGVKLPPSAKDNVVQTTVHLVGDMTTADLGLRVDIVVKVKGLSQIDLDKLVAQTKRVCPYSRATEGNVHTTVEAVAL